MIGTISGPWDRFHEHERGVAFDSLEGPPGMMSVISGRLYLPIVRGQISLENVRTIAFARVVLPEMSQKGPDIFDVAEYRKSTPLTGVRSWTFTRFVIATEFRRVDWVFLNEAVDLAFRVGCVARGATRNKPIRKRARG
jgi:hypothetical protein